MSAEQNGSTAGTPSPERLGSEEHPLEEMKRVLICGLYSEKLIAQCQRHGTHVTVWKDEKPKCNKTCDSCLWFSCGIGPNSEGECMQSGASCKRGSDACDEWTNK